MIDNSRYSFSVFGLFVINFPWVIIFIFRNSGLIKYNSINNDLGLYLFLFLFLSNLFYLYGCFLSKSLYKSRKDFININYKFKNVFIKNILLIFLLTYIGLMCYDYFISKKGSLLNITEIREIDNLSGSRMSFLGGVIVLTSSSPFIFLAYNIYNLKKYSIIPSKFELFLSFFGVGVSFLSGGRNSFLIGMIILFLFKNIISFKITTFFHPKVIRIMYSIFFISVFYSFFIFIERELNQGIYLFDIISNFSSKWGIELIEPQLSNVFFYSIFSIFLISIFYLTHPITFLDQYFSSNYFPLLYGSYNFPVLVKTWDFITGIRSFEQISDNLIVNGVYLTLPGSFLLDFGFIYSYLLIAFISLLYGFLYSRKRYSNFFTLILISFLSCFFILSPLYSIFAIGNGFSFLVIIFSCAFINLFK